MLKSKAKMCNIIKSMSSVRIISYHAGNVDGDFKKMQMWCSGDSPKKNPSNSVLKTPIAGTTHQEGMLAETLIKCNSPHATHRVFAGATKSAAHRAAQKKKLNVAGQCGQAI